MKRKRFEAKINKKMRKGIKKLVEHDLELCPPTSLEHLEDLIIDYMWCEIDPLAPLEEFEITVEGCFSESEIKLKVRTNYTFCSGSQYNEVVLVDIPPALEDSITSSLGLSRSLEDAFFEQR